MSLDNNNIVDLDLIKDQTLKETITFLMVRQEIKAMLRNNIINILN